MSSPTSRRRPSAAVYRRRRLVALVLLLLVIALIVALVWVLVAQPWRGSASEPQPAPSASATTPAPSTSPAASETPAPVSAPAPTAAATPNATPNPTATAAPACTAGDLTVEALTDKGEYASGENPQLSIKLTNKGARDCTINVGTSAQAFTITSGSDTWWRSTDCQTEPSDMVVTLAAGQSVQSAAPLTWDRTRSSVSSCDGSNRERASGGGATYRLAVSIGGVPSAQTASFLLY
jgi:cytoskeletal protein RodZ